MTVPWTYHRMFAPQDARPIWVTLSVLNTIVSSDTSTDANIDMVVYQAMGPDFQVAYPCTNTKFVDPYALITNLSLRKKQKKEKKPKPQSHIDAEFCRSFPSIIDNCMMYADAQVVTSETTHTVKDIFRRYVDAQIRPHQTFPTAYTPATNSVQYLFFGCFLFYRGGVNYKVIHEINALPPEDLSSSAPTTMFAGLCPTGEAPTALIGQTAIGGAYIEQAQTGGELAIAVPWTNNIAYYQRNVYDTSTTPEGVALWDPDNAEYENQTNQYQYATMQQGVQDHVVCCVRDDFEVGFLIPPEPLSLSRKKEKKRAPSPARSRSLSPFTKL